MKIEKIKLNDIVPTDYNPRTISPEEITKLKNSISTFGFVDPIIINLNNNHIIGGHQRYNVLQDQYMLNNEFDAELNLITLGDVGWVFPNTNLKVESEDYEKALNIALNNISGEFDEDKLTEALSDLKLKDIDIPILFTDVKITNDNDIFDFLDEDELDISNIQQLTPEYKTTQSQNIILKFPTSNKVIITEEEYLLFEKRYEDYVNENGDDKGFISYLLKRKERREIYGTN